MDLYGISNARAQSNNYISSYNDSVGRIKDANDTIALQRQQATGQANTAVDMDSIKDTILTTKSIVGTGGAFKAYGVYSSKRKASRQAKQLTSGIESTVESGTSNRLANPDIPGGNEPSIQLSGDSGQKLGHADNPKPQATAQPQQTQQQAQQQAKEDDGDEVRGAEPVEDKPTTVSLDEPPEGAVPKKGASFTSKIAEGLEISEETAGKLGSIAGGSAGLAGLTMGIMADEGGGFHHMTNAEKVGNVSSMIGSGAEVLGTALDMTGFGATIGVPLQLIGGVSDLVGTLFSSGAEIKKAEQTKASAQEAQNKPELKTPVLQATAQSAGVIPTIQSQTY